MVKKSARRTLRTHSPAFKARLALAALWDDKTMTELWKEFELYASQVIEWKLQLLEGAADAFAGSGQATAPVDLAPLHAKIGQLALVHTEQASHRAFEPGLGSRHDLHPYAARLRVPDGRGGRSQSPGAGAQGGHHTEAGHAREIIELAFARWGMPDIVNTDQGNQFTATQFTDVVLAKGCQLSMDGRGAWRDNVLVERLWRSVKCERVYLKAYASVSVARTDIADYINWYNAGRAHSSLNRQRRTSTTSPSCRRSPWPHKMRSLVRPELPTASVGSLQALTDAVDNSAPSATRPQST